MPGAGVSELPGDGRGMFSKDRFLLVVALSQPDALATAKVYRRPDLHRYSFRLGPWYAGRIEKQRNPKYATGAILWQGAPWRASASVDRSSECARMQDGGCGVQGKKSLQRGHVFYPAHCIPHPQSFVLTPARR